TIQGVRPNQLIGYGLVVGLDGTGDRSFGSNVGAVHTVRSVTNLLRRFNVEIPSERLRLRNVAAVLVTAEVPPHLRPGARFEVQVASLGDATSLKGGVLWMTPLQANPDDLPLATAQGAMPVSVGEERTRFGRRGSGSGRIPEGGILEAALPAVAPVTATRLLLRSPDLSTAARIAAAIDSAMGSGTARALDPGAIALTLPASATDNPVSFLAAIDTIQVGVSSAARIVIDARTGVVVVGGAVGVGDAVVSLSGITVKVGGQADSTAAAPPDGLLAFNTGATAQDVAAGLRALGASPPDVVAVFDGLRAAGAVHAQVVVR
ncbi:MAG TPA: flagellar basal body P-ring protein FlgI, partial [Gemmatimonadales bacterium]|nr:flagellar basal body P-ring protein FlgI [Gemmatimonadales bacterium]